MTRDEYTAYEERFRQFMETEGIENLSPESENEPYFSWHFCDCCGSRLGGYREDYIGYCREDDEVMGPYSICTDCVYYAAYGRLDDMTMREIEESES